MADVAAASANEGVALPRSYDTAVQERVNHVSSLWPVLNCNDDGGGSLRAVVASNQTHSGDIVDLSQLNCGTITLLTGAIVVPQADLKLIGTGPQSLTIDAAHSSRLFEHAGGTLSLEHLALSSGTYFAAGPALGGCVRSTGNVYLLDVLIDDCHASSDTDVASGGAVSAANVTLVSSSISGSSAVSAGKDAYGGGVAVTDTAIAKYSQISNNSVRADSPNKGLGGGIYARSYALLLNTTIDHNEAPCSSAVATYGSANIQSSTISDNHSFGCAAVEIIGQNAYIANSTIALNHADQGIQAGLDFQGINQITCALTVQSSIVADNTVGDNDMAADLSFAWALLHGGDNLVTSTSGPTPPGFVALSVEPQLGPLQWNGGPTKTRALRATSPAIGAGNDVTGAANDQRGSGYPRTTGTSSSVDIGAFQFDSIFADSFYR